MVWQKCTIEWHHWFVINHSELLEYNHLVPLHGGLQDGVNIIKDRIFQHVRPVRFYSPTMYLWKDWLAKLRFFSLMFSPLPITKQQQKKPCINFTPDKKQIQNLVHFITWQSLHLHSFIFLIRPFITWLTPKWKAVNNLAILTPADTSRYTPHNHQVNVPSLHINTNEHTTNLGLETTFTL